MMLAAQLFLSHVALYHAAVYGCCDFVAVSHGQASQAGSALARLQLLAHVAQLQLQGPALLKTSQRLQHNSHQAEDEAPRTGGGGGAAALAPWDKRTALLQARSSLQV